MAVPKRKTSPSKRGMRRSADALDRGAQPLLHAAGGGSGQTGLLKVLPPEKGSGITVAPGLQATAEITTDEREADIIIAKHRNGPTGMARLNFRKHFTRFESYTSRTAG